jgi:hypothetical protein
MPGNSTTTSLSHHQAFDIEGDVVSHPDIASKCFDDDRRLKRTGTKFHSS